MQRLIGLIIVMVLLLIGCSNTENKQNEIIITPIQLFEGEEIKYKPFVGDMSGAFKLAYNGEKPNISLSVDVWGNGKRVKTIGGVYDLFFASVNHTVNEFEIIVSMNLNAIEDQEDGVMEVKINNRSEKGYTFVTFSAPWKKELNARSLITHNEEISITDKQPIHVLGLQATSTNQLRTADFSSESLERLEHAIIITINFDE